MKLRACFSSVRFGSLVVGVHSKLLKSVNHLLGTGKRRINSPNCDNEGFTLANDSDSSDSDSSNDGYSLRRAQNANTIQALDCPEARHVIVRYHIKGKFYKESDPLAEWIYNKFVGFAQLRNPANEKEAEERKVVASYDVIELANDLGLLDAAAASFIQVLNIILNMNYSFTYCCFYYGLILYTVLIYLFFVFEVHGGRKGRKYESRLDEDTTYSRCVFLQHAVSQESGCYYRSYNNCNGGNGKRRARSF